MVCAARRQGGRPDFADAVQILSDVFRQVAGVVGYVFFQEIALITDRFPPLNGAAYIVLDSLALAGDRVDRFDIINSIRHRRFGHALVFHVPVLSGARDDTLLS